MPCCLNIQQVSVALLHTRKAFKKKKKINIMKKRLYLFNQAFFTLLYGPVPIRDSLCCSPLTALAPNMISGFELPACDSSVCLQCSFRFL